MKATLQTKYDKISNIRKSSKSTDVIYTLNLLRKVINESENLYFKIQNF